RIWPAVASPNPFRRMQRTIRMIDKGSRDRRQRALTEPITITTSTIRLSMRTATSVISTNHSLMAPSDECPSQPSSSASAERPDPDHHAHAGGDPDQEQEDRGNERHRHREHAFAVDQTGGGHRRALLAQAQHEPDMIDDAADEHQDA